MASNMQTVGKKIQGSTSDRISHLPANVKDKILTCMPLRDAVRTSILSRKWRYAWVTLPELVFNDKFCLGLGRPQASKLLMAVYQVLLLHRGPILKFKLCLSPTTTAGPEIDQLLLFVSNNGIEELVLNLWGDEPYKLPSSVFSCAQLKHLELDFCLFKPPPTFKGFCRLLSLDLRSVDITSEVLSSLVSSCPLLEKLKLVICPSITDLEISAPKLKCLYFGGETICSICLKNSPNLARVSLYFRSMTWETSKWDSVFADPPVVEFLEFGYGCLKSIFAGGAPRRLPSVLSHMKILKLHLELNEVPSMLCLVRSSPNLRKIEISLPPNSDLIEDDESLEGPLDLRGWADISLNQLKEVELRDGCGTRFELELAKLVLAKSPILEKMVIVLDYLIQPLESKFLEEVKRLRPLSPLAKVSCKIPSRYF